MLCRFQFYKKKKKKKKCGKTSLPLAKPHRRILLVEIFRPVDPEVVHMDPPGVHEDLQGVNVSEKKNWGFLRADPILDRLP